VSISGRRLCLWHLDAHIGPPVPFARLRTTQRPHNRKALGGAVSQVRLVIVTFGSEHILLNDIHEWEPRQPQHRLPDLCPTSYGRTAPHDKPTSIRACTIRSMETGLYHPIDGNAPASLRGNPIYVTNSNGPLTHVTLYLFYPSR
jgi:hypothetical protein